MKVKDFDGREHIFNLNKLSCQFNNPSKLHIKAIEILNNFLPYTKIYNEVTLLGCKGVNGVVLTADIFVPSFGLVIEVHGQQHYEFSKFFHKTKANFESYKRNDEIKKQWCELNDLAYIELKYDEVDQWKDKIKHAIY